MLPNYNSCGSIITPIADLIEPQTHNHQQYPHQQQQQVLREGCTLSGFTGLLAPIRLDIVGPPHRDVDAGQSRWGR